MSSFRFLKKIKGKIFLFSFFSIFCENDFFRITSDVSLNGSVFVEGNENLTGKLECGSLRLLFGNFSNTGNLVVQGNLSLKDFSSVGSFTFPDFSAESLNINSLNLNLGVNSEDEIKIGNENGKSVNIKSSLNKGIFIGDKTDQVKIGNENSGDISINAEKQNNGNIKFVSKTLNFDIADFEYPENDDLKLLKINSSGFITTDDDNLSLGNDLDQSGTIIEEATFNNLSSIGEINFLGEFSTDENSIVRIGNGTGELIIGDENAENVKFIGQWDVAGNDIQIGSLNNTETIVGYSDDIVRLGQYLNTGDFYLQQNDLSIILPENEDQYFLLKIKDDGSVFTELPGDQNRNYSFMGVESGDLNCFADLYVIPVDYMNIGNLSSGNTTINSGNLLSINGGDVLLKGVGLKLSDFSSLPNSGKKHLMIDEEGFVRILNIGPAENLNIQDLIVNGNFSAVEGRVKINLSENGLIKIANTSNSGTVSIGNSSSNDLTLDSINLNIGNVSGTNIYLGNNSQTKNIVINSNEDISFSAPDLFFELLNNNDDLVLSIDSDKKIGYEQLSYYDDDNNIYYFKNVNLEDCTLNGLVEIGNSDSYIDISGSVLKIGDEDLTETVTFDADLNLITKDLVLSSDQIYIGDQNNSIVNIGSFNENGKLAFLFDSIILPDSSLYNYNIFIDEDGKILTKELLTSGITDDTGINSEGSYDTTIGNLGAGEIQILSKNNTELGAENINLTADNSIYVLSSDIDAPGGAPIALYINLNGRLTTDSNLTRNKLPVERIKNLNLTDKSIKVLSPKIFDYVNQKLRGDSEDAGFIAEELLLNTDFENCVIKDDSNNVISINYDSVFCGICSNYRNFISKIEKLKNRVNKSKQKVLNLAKEKNKKNQILG